LIVLLDAGAASAGEEPRDLNTEPFTPSDDPEDFDPFAGGEIGRTAPLTPEQEELWLSVQLGGEPANLAYNQAVVVHLTGALDPAALRAALDALVTRHEALRSTLSGDGSVLCIARSGKMALSERDLSGLTSDERARKVAETRAKAVRTPFDLVKGPLIRAELLSLGEREHELVLCAHHIVFDGWSASLLLDELGKLYSAHARGTEPALAAPWPFGAYAAQRAAEAGSESGARDLEFWRARFAELPPALELPLDHARPAERSFEADRVDLDLAEDLVARLKAVSAAQGASLATLLFASFQAFVHRITGQRSLAIVLPAAGQSIVGQPVLAGHCVRSLPVRADIDPERSFAEHLQDVKRAMLDAIEHSKVTFGGLIKALALPRDPSRIPLASIMFNVDSSAAPPRFEGLDVRVSSVPRAFESFELFVSVGVSAERASIQAQFSTKLFERHSIERRLREFVSLLEDVGQNVEQKVGELAVMPARELEEVVSAVNQTRTGLATETLCAQFRDNAVKTPGMIAVTCAGRALTYAELDQASAALAQELCARGIGPGSFVGVFLARSVELLTALLGILRAGAAYVPLDPDYPRERLEFIVSDAKLSAVVTEQALVPLVPSGPRTFSVDAPREDATTDLDNSALQDPAYVIYTSGSTGKPKGVIVEHRNVANFLSSMRRRPGLAPSDVWLAITTPSFDISVLEMFLPLVVGARVVLATHDEITDGRKLARLIETSKATVMQATPAGWRVLLEAGWQGSPSLKALSGGEALGAELAASLLSRTQSLWNCYGPTETTIWSTLEEVKGAPITIGRPLDNTMVYVLDDAQRPVPPGVTGHLYIGGEGVARGYHERPALTEERFLQDPFAGSGRMYKTGDLARLGWDGRLEWLGRSDFQVKVRGHRIELGEIEARLCECEGVREAVVVVREDRPQDQRIVAYVRADPSSEIIETSLREALRDRLPSYLLPQHVVVLEAFPLTPNGKVDRRALPAPEAGRGDAYRPPENELQRTLAEMIAELVGAARVGLSDDFFLLGGHSMSALRLAARIRAAFGLDLPMRVVFGNPTLEGISSFVEATLLVKRGSGVRPASPAKEREEVLL
jgi:amino acid adenylation domain-containing protein